MILDKFSLNGKTAIVTGSGRGIGRGIALAFAEAGADVVCCSRTEKEIDDVAEAVTKIGRKSLALKCDVTDSDQVDGLIGETVKQFGRIDILVNNVGGSIFKPAVRMSKSEFESVVGLNLVSTFLCSRAAAGVMLERKTGSIINISTRDSIIPCPGLIAYGAAKAGINSFTKTLAWELAPYIRVNGILVGGVWTEGSAPAVAPFKDQIVDGTPMKRMGLPEDIALAAIFLASPASDWVTGRMFEIDGGIEFVHLDLSVPKTGD